MNFCAKCGSTIIPGSNVCPTCGEPVILNNDVISQQMMDPSFQNVQPSQPMVEQSSLTQEVPVPQQQNVVAVPDVNNVPNMEPGPSFQETSVSSGSDNQMPVAPEIPVAPTVTDIQPAVNQQNDSKKQKKDKPELTSEEKEKKFNKITTITVIVVSIVALLLMSFFMYKALFSKKDEAENQIKNATQYNYEGFEFYLPEGITASVENGLFVVKATDSSWSAIITIQEGSYNTLISNKSQISGYFENLGYVSGEVVENEVSGMGFVTTEVLMGSQNVLVAYSKASGTKVYGIIYVNELFTYDNYSLKTVGEILASSNNKGEMTTMPAGFTVDMFNQTFDAAR